MIVNWFIRMRGMALALAAAGFSVASFLVPQIGARLIHAVGWRTAVAAIACVAAAIVAPAIALLAVRRPEDVGQHPDGEAPLASDGSTPHLLEIPLARLLREPNFWLVGIGLSIALCVSLPTFFLVRYMQKELAIPVVQAANVPSTIAVFGLIGKLVGGFAIDRLDKRLVIVAALVLHALGWVVAVTQSSLAGMLVAAIPLGLGGGGFLALPAALQAACFGRAMIGRVSGLHALLGLPFLLTVAPLVGLLEQRTGSFVLPFLGLAGTLLVAALVLASVRVPKVEPGL
jgi:MFS family permease